MHNILTIMNEIIHKRGDNVPDYKKMYLEMMCETEKAINILIAAQRRCEEIYISAPETEITVLPVTEGDHER